MVWMMGHYPRPEVGGFAAYVLFKNVDSHIQNIGMEMVLMERYGCIF